MSPDLPTIVTPIPGQSPNFPWTLVKIPGYLKKFLSLATLARVGQNRRNHTKHCHIDGKKMIVQEFPGRLVKLQNWVVQIQCKKL